MASREFGIVLKVTDKGFGVFDVAGEKVKKLGEHTDRASARFQASTERLKRLRAATAAATTQKQNLSLAMQNASEKSLRLTAGSIRLTEAYAQLTTEGGNVGMGLAALTSGFAEIIPLTRDLGKNLKDMKASAIGAASSFKNAMGSMSLATGGLIAALGLLAIALETAFKKWEEFDTKAMGDFVKSSNKAGEELKKLGAVAKDLGVAGKDMREAFGSWSGVLMAGVQPTEEMRASMERLGITQDQVRASTDKYAQAQAGLNKETKNLTGTLDQYQLNALHAELAATEAAKAEAAAAAKQAEEKGKVADALERSKKLWDEHRAKLQAAREETTRVVVETSRFREQLEALQGTVSSFDIGTGITTEFDKDAPEIKQLIDRLQDLAGKAGKVGSDARAVLQAMSTGDTGALNAMASAFESQRAWWESKGSKFKGSTYRAGIAFTMGQIIGNLLSAIREQAPARALGGPVVGGQAYMVGERGPELFVPSGSGGIASNQSLGKMEQLLAAIAGETSNLRRDMASGLIQASITEGGVRRLGATIFDLAGRNELGRA